MSTLREREEKARASYTCTRCGAEAGRPCHKWTPGGWIGRAMVTVHPERMAKLPFELEWRAQAGGGYRAVDSRTSPATVYSVYRDKGAMPEHQWMLVSWSEGQETKAQRKTGLSSANIAKRLAMSSRCFRCGSYRPFGELEDIGKGFYRCRDHDACQAREEAEKAAERAEVWASRSEDHERIEFTRDAYGLPQVMFTKSGNRRVIDLTRADLAVLASGAMQYLADNELQASRPARPGRLGRQDHDESTAGSRASQCHQVQAGLEALRQRAG